MSDHADTIREMLKRMPSWVPISQRDDALAALAALEAELAETRQERDEAVWYAQRCAADEIDRARMPLTQRAWLEAVDRAEAAEAENEQLKETLDELVSFAIRMPGYSHHPLTEKARSFASGSEGVEPSDAEREQTEADEPPGYGYWEAGDYP